MTIVDQLLKADVKKADELETGTFMSKKLAHILGAEDPVEVAIREVKARRINDIAAYQIDKKGNMDYYKVYDAKLMLVTEGCVEPDLRNKDLQNHFNCASAKDLAEKLFGTEVAALSDAISLLSQVDTDGSIEEEIKNS